MANKVSTQIQNWKHKIDRSFIINNMMQDVVKLSSWKKRVFNTGNIKKPHSTFTEVTRMFSENLNKLVRANVQYLGITSKTDYSRFL